MVAAFKAKKNNKDDIATSDGVESDTDGVTLEESEKLFRIKMSWMKRKRGLVLNYITDICDKEQQEAFVGWKRSGCFVHMLQLVVKVFETAPAYI